jgi:hypothetical protein
MATSPAPIKTFTKVLRAGNRSSNKDLHAAGTAPAGESVLSDGHVNSGEIVLLGLVESDEGSPITPEADSPTNYLKDVTGPECVLM